MVSPDDERAQPYPTHSFSSPLASHKSSPSSFPSRNRSSSLDEQTPRNTFSCEREVLHPLDPKSEPGAFLFYDSDDSIEEKRQRPPKRNCQEAFSGISTSTREQMPDFAIQKPRKLKSSASFGGDKAPSEPEVPPTSILSSLPIPKQDMHPLSGVNSSSSASREEYSPSTERSMPSQRAYEVSPHAPEYTLFPTTYKQLPPIHRHCRRGAEDFDAPELGEVLKDSTTSPPVVKGKAVHMLYSNNSQDDNLQDLDHGCPGWTVKSSSRATQSSFKDIFDSLRTGLRSSNAEHSGPGLAPTSPAALRARYLSRDGISPHTAPLDRGSQFSLPVPPYINEVAKGRRQHNCQTGIYGGTLLKDDTRFQASPEQESHDPFHGTASSSDTRSPPSYRPGHRHRNTCTTSSSHNTSPSPSGAGNTSCFSGCPDNLPNNPDTPSGNKPPDHRNDRALITHNTNPQQIMAGSAVSVACKGKAADRSNYEDVSNVPKTPTTPPSEFHRRPSSVTTGIDVDTATATTSGSSFQQNIDSLVPIGSLVSINPDNTNASVPASAATSRDTVTSGSYKATSSFTGENHHRARFSVDSIMSEHTPERSDSGSRGLHTPTRLVGKVRSIFKPVGSGSMDGKRGASRRSVSSESAVDPDKEHQTVFEEHLMLQTLEHRYQQHSLDRRQELVEALQYLTSPSAPLEGATLLNEFRRLRLETDSLFLLELEKDALEKQKEHELQLNAAAARHERIRRDAESVRNDFETQLRIELERRREEEKRELDRIRQAKADQELAERRRQVELARAQAAEKLRQAELEKQRREEETRIKAAEDTKKIVEEKARAKAEAERQARIKAEEDKKAADLLAVSAAARGTSFTSVERENDNVDHMQDEYLRLHALLKGFRSWLVRHAKESPALKAKMGDMRREIKKTVGQLTAGKNANREPLSRITNVLNQALNDTESPKIDVRQFFILPNEREIDSSVMNQPPDRPALFLYLLNIFAKAVIAQFIDEAGVNPKAAEPVGVVAVTIFASENFKWRGTPLIDILIAKFRRVCPVLFGLYGKDTTQAGRRRLGWHATDGEEWVSEQLHAERMTGLGAGYAAITLRNFSKSRMMNPYANVKYWQSLQWVCGVPPLEATDTHFIVLKAMIENYAGKFIDLYGDAAKLALRKSLVTFPKESGRNSAAVQAAAALADVLRRDEMIYLTDSEKEAEAKAIMAGILFR